MPLTAKGEKIKGAMEEEYGKEKGEEVFYASANKGTITGVHDAQETTTRLGQICDSIGHLCSRFDAFLRGKGRVDAQRVIYKGWILDEDTDGSWRVYKRSAGMVSGEYLGSFPNLETGKRAVDAQMGR